MDNYPSFSTLLKKHFYSFLNAGLFAIYSSLNQYHNLTVSSVELRMLLHSIWWIVPSLLSQTKIEY